MNNNFNTRPSYKENLAHVEEQISHWKEEVRKAEKPYFKAKEKESARRNTYKEDGENDWESREPLAKKLDKTMNAFHEAESNLKKWQEKQEKILAEDKDYYAQRDVHLKGQFALWKEKYEHAKGRYDTYSKRDPNIEKNQMMIRKAEEEMDQSEKKLDRYADQIEMLHKKDKEQYNYEKRYALGEQNYHAKVEKITDEIVRDLKKEKPLKIGGKHATDKLSPMWTDKQREEEDRLTKNDPRNKVKSGSRSRQEIEESVYNQQMYDDEESSKSTQKGFIDEIDKVLKVEVPQTGRLYEGEVVKIDQHGNAVLSFYGGDMDGLMYNRGNTGLKVGDKKLFKFEERSKRRGRYIFTFPPKKKKSESAVTEDVENALV